MKKHNSELSRFVFVAIAGLVLAVLAIAGWAVQPGATSAAGDPDSSITICKSTNPANADLVDFDTDIPGMPDADPIDPDNLPFHHPPSLDRW